MLISISSALIANYNGLKNSKVSKFNLCNVLLVGLYLSNINPMISIFLAVALNLVIYKILYIAIISKI